MFVDRFSKMVHLVAVPESINVSAFARVFIDTIFRLHGLPRELVSDQDPRFTAEFWRSMFKTLGTRLQMSTSDHPETDVRQNVQTAFLRKSFGVTSIRSRIGANSCQWWNSHQQLGACIDDSYTVLCEWLAPPTPTHLLRV